MRKIKFNEIVIFPKKFKMNGLQYNCIVQQSDGVLLFFDKDYMDAKELQRNLKTNHIIWPH